MVWLIVSTVLSAGAVVAAGTILARSGDQIAARTNLGGVWFGSVFLAAATSLPEIVTDVAAVRLDAIDLAAGDLFGSSMANMLILALVTLLPAGTDLFKRAALDHALYAMLAIILTALAALFVLLRPTFALAGVGIGSAVLLATYAVGSRAVFRHTSLARRALATAEMTHTEEVSQPKPRKGAPLLDNPLLRPAAGFIAAALVIVIAAPTFARSAEGIANVTGLGTTFVGTWLVGLSTSLPELVTSISAVRMKAFDLAVGNLFGSNAFNMCLFIVLDVAHGGGPIFAALSNAHVYSALSAIVLMGIGTAAIAYRAQGRLTLLEPSGGLMLLAYMLGLAAVLAQST